MKFALVVCFAALVACEPEAKPEAEADPALSTPPMAMVLTHTLTPDSTTAMLDTTPVTLTLTTTARDLLMLRLSLRLRLIRGWLMVMVTHMLTEDTDTDTPDTLMLTTESTTARGPLTPSLRLMPMPTMATMATPGPTDTDTDTDWDTEDTTGDKFSGPEVQSRSSKRTSLLVI